MQSSIFQPNGAFAKPSPRRGLTKIAIVVVLLLVVTFAILIPFVFVESWEAARRSTCKSQLKLFGIALHNFHDVHGHLPHGYRDDSTLEADPDGHWTWLMFIYPMLESSNFYMDLSPADMSVTDAVTAINDPFKQNWQSLFACPSSAIPNFAPDYPPATLVVDDSEISLPLGSYVGVHSTNVPTTEPTDGPFYRNSEVTFGDIEDGLANTILVGERRWEMSSVRVGGATLFVMPRHTDDESPYLRTALGSTAFPINTAPDPSESGDPKRSAFSSAHPGGAQFVMGDGSVRFLVDDTDLDVLHRLTTIAGNEEVKLP